MSPSEEAIRGGARVAPPDVLIIAPPTDISDLRWIDAPGLVAFWALAAVVFLQFFTRYVLNDSLAWTEEVARYLLILVAFLGSITATRKGGHIALEFLIRRAPGGLAKALAVTAQAFAVLFYGTMFWIGVELVQRTRQKMVTLPVPKSWIYAICVAALAAMTVYAAITLWQRLRQSPDEIRAALDTSIPKD